MYHPVFKGPIEGYAVNYTTRHFWRVQATMERDDVLQEAYIVFARCAAKYPEVDTPQHFMALFKRAWANHFTDLANYDSRTRAAFLPITVRQDEEGSDVLVREPVGELDNEGRLGTLLRQAPAEVMLVLNLFFSAPQELVELALASWEPDTRRNNGGNARINRLLGLPAEHDSVGRVREYFAVEAA